MDFDPLSYGLGFASSTALSLAVWRYRVRLSRMQQSAESGIEGTRQFIGQAADARYMRDITRYAQQYHQAGHLFDLESVLIEPRLTAPPPPVMGRAATDEEDEPLAQDIFRAVPIIHDMPQSYAPYNIKTLPLSDLSTGDRHVAILGVSGTGKSTTLAVLALMALGEVTFESRESISQQAAVEEEQGLSELERIQRARERQQIVERAQEKIEQARRLKEEQLTKAQAQLSVLEIKGLLPVLVHLNDIELDPAALGASKGNLDPAEPLVRAVQHHVSTMTSQVVGSVIYPALERGGALVLIDGYDELSPDAQQTYYHWLCQLVDIYSQNMIIIAGPVTGYDALVTAGFTPVFMRAWMPENYTELAQKWAQAWSAQDAAHAAPDDQAMRRLTADNRGRGILNVTFKLWAALADDTRETGRVGWYDAMINRRLSSADARAVLPVLGERILENGGPVARAALQTALAEALPAPQNPKEKDNRAAQAVDLISGLVKDGLLCEAVGDRLTFPHPQITSYLASERLVAGSVERAAELALNPLWKDALGFAAGKIDMLPVIRRKLSVTPDLMYSDLFDLARWMPDAPTTAPWRGDLFKRLAAALMAPEQFLHVRERAMAALVAAHDRNVLFVFRQAFRSTEAQIRRLACIGSGALGDAEAVRDLETMLNDPEPEVQLASALALGAIGTEKSLEAMVRSLINGNQQLRRAVAEALAAVPGDGHDVLRDGIESDDLNIRRASVFGLARINEPWALSALHKAMFEDEQFMVRTTAESAFMAAQAPHSEGPRSHPDADSLGWLVAWAAERGEGVPTGPNARMILIHALQDGAPEFKVYSAQTIGRLGYMPAIKPLYAGLRDRQADVRNAIYVALSDMQTRLGRPLPGLA